MLLVAGLLLPGTAGARTITKQTELGEVTVDGKHYSLKPEGAARDPSITEAQAAGSPLGRIPRNCRDRRRVGARIVCLVNKIFAADLVSIAFLVGAVTGEGSLACPVLIEAERIRLGGALCPQRIASAAPQFERREPQLIYIEATGFGRNATATSVVLLDHPRDAALIELGVTPRRYWRITDVSDLFP